MKLPLEAKKLIQIRANSPGVQPYFDSRIEEVTPDRLLISWPVKGKQRMALREQEVVLVIFTLNQRLYECDGLILDVISIPVPMLSVRLSGSLRSVQRRNDYRIRAMVPVELAARVVGLAGYKDARTRVSRIACETIDISGGGFRIVHGAPLAAGMVFEAKLLLADESRQPLIATARIVHCSEISAPDGPERFEVGFAFLRISETARQRIVRFIFSTQRDERLES